MNELFPLKYLSARTARRVVFCTLALLWCGVIFYLSSQNGDTSSETSGGIIDVICELAVPEFSGMPTNERTSLVESLQFIVRKSAHFTAYLLLSVFSLQFFLTLKKPKKILHKFLSAWGFCIFYAATDEFHQLFVSGRSSQLRDVAIDSLGALCGLLISAAIRKTYIHFHRKNANVKIA